MKKLLLIALLALTASCSKEVEVEVETIVYREDVAITSGLKNQIKDLTNQVNALNANIDLLSGQATILSESNVLLGSDNNVLNTLVDELENKLDTAITDYNANLITINVLNGKLEELNNTVEMLSTSLDRYATEEEHIPGYNGLFSTNIADVPFGMFDVLDILGTKFIVTNYQASVNYDGYTYFTIRANGNNETSIQISFRYTDIRPHVLGSVIVGVYRQTTPTNTHQLFRSELFTGLYDFSSEFEEDVIAAIALAIEVLE